MSAFPVIGGTVSAIICSTGPKYERKRITDENVGNQRLYYSRLAPLERKGERREKGKSEIESLTARRKAEVAG